MDDSVGARFRQVRKALRLTQSEAARIAGKGRAATVSAWETGAAKPSIGDLRLLADRAPEKQQDTFRYLSGGGELPAWMRREGSGEMPHLRSGDAPVMTDPQLVRLDAAKELGMLATRLQETIDDAITRNELTTRPGKHALGCGLAALAAVLRGHGAQVGKLERFAQELIEEGEG